MNIRKKISSENIADEVVQFHKTVIIEMTILPRP